MIQLTGYQVTAHLYQSSNSQVYRGIRQADNQAIILKCLQDDYPSPQQLTNYRQEYDITRELNLAGVVKVYELINYRNSLVIVLEDFGGQSLKDLNLAGTLSLEAFLLLAIQLCDILGQVHQHHVMHKDINPANWVFNPVTNVVKLIDFGLSTRLSREYTNFHHLNGLEGTLAYISPEQTGRMNRAIDYRTDLYSLGVTLYELLTGELPFEDTDPMALVHAHIARQPITPLEKLQIKNHKSILNKTPYALLSDIIMKLLAKNAEDRYQSAFGLKYDLERVMEYEVSSDLLPTLLGQRDFSGRFQIPQKLYGRDAEVGILLDAFERVANPNPINFKNMHNLSGLLLVVGYSGVGKSALVHEIHKPITEKRGYFISGKYDQFQRNVPYYALTQALNEFCQLLLTETETRLTAWKQMILAAIGNNGQVLIEVIPNLGWVIGEQPIVPEVGPQESRNRFNLVFRHFMTVICQPEHPLVMFIDDLQWADSASLELLTQMLMDTANLLIIGAYRGNEVDITHPLMRWVDGLKKESLTIQTLSLPNLTVTDVTALVAETLQSNPETVSDLVNLLYEKTQGNAFFLTQCLISLYEQGQLEFNHITMSWQWDVEQIRGLKMSDNVIELMADKLARLDETTQVMLKLAACIGNKFTLSTLSIISEQATAEVLWALWPAIEEGLIITLDENYRQILLDTYSQVDSQLKFVHDRVQQAAYSLITENDRAATHLKIGRLWLAEMKGGVEERLFDIINQLNMGRELIDDEAEKLHLAQLNLQASQKAKSANAYQTALNNITIALSLLPQDSWMSHYRFTFDVTMAQGNCQFLTGQFAEAEATFKLALEQAQTNLEKGHIYSALVTLYTHQLDFKQCIMASSQGLQTLGIEIPMEGEAVAAAIRPALGQIQAYLADKEIASILNLPKLTDETKLKALELCSSILPIAFITGNFNLYTLIDLKMIILSLESGNSIFASMAYVGYGVILVMGFKDYRQAYEWGRLGLQLVETYPFGSMHIRNYFTFASFVNYWRQPAKTSAAYLLQVYIKGSEMGELSYAGYANAGYMPLLFFMGVKLESIEQETIKSLAIAEKTKDRLGRDVLLITLHHILALKGHIDFQDSRLTDESISQIARSSSYRAGLVRYFVQCLKTAYLLGRYQIALEAVQEVTPLLKQAAGIISFVEFYFYHTLTLVALWPTLAETDQAVTRETITAHHALMKNWHEHCPENFEAMDLLLSAEVARLHGQGMECLELYDKAIASAKAQEFLHIEALANELAAKFWLALGKTRFAEIYLREAHYVYQQWGATVKVKQLEQQYPDLQHAHVPLQRANVSQQTLHSDSSRTSQLLDLASVMKAAQTISGEIELNKLLDTLMRIVIENAGAQNGYLILKQQEKWLIVVSGSINQPEGQQFEPIPLINAEQYDVPLLPITIINYVIRTSQPLVLNDASQNSSEGHFANDRYVMATQLKSVLCMPLVSQGKIIGLVYLENNLSPGVFTPDRLELLNLLSSQVIISLENARLYLDLQSSEQKYRTIFEDSKDMIFITHPNGQIIDINPACFQILGYTREEMLQMNAIEVYAEPATRQRFREAMQQNRMVKDFAAVFRRKNHELIDILMTATSWQDNKGTITRYQGVVRDVTALKRAENERLQLSTIQRELAIAHEMQNSLLQHPKPTWTGIEIICHNIPAKEVGGDFYKYHLTADKYIFAIGDVSGKGVPASLLMATSLSQFDASLVLNLTAVARMVYLDTVISPYTKPKKQNCALCYIEINPITYELQAINAGCIPPYIKRVKGKAEPLELGGFALGQGLGAKLGYQSLTRLLSPGDMVILTSDGVVEANNKAKELLGFDNLQAMIEHGPTTSAEAMLNHLKQAIAIFTDDADPHDDLTIMVIQLNGYQTIP